jgi:hypothetical protein
VVRDTGNDDSGEAGHQGQIAHWMRCG